MQSRHSFLSLLTVSCCLKYPVTEAFLIDVTGVCTNNFVASRGFTFCADDCDNDVIATLFRRRSNYGKPRSRLCHRSTTVSVDAETQEPPEETKTTDVYFGKDVSTLRLVRTKKHRSVIIKPVRWAGYGGMLPLQRYRNSMPTDDIQRWLRKPYPSLPIHQIYDGDASGKEEGNDGKQRQRDDADEGVERLSISNEEEEEEVVVGIDEKQRAQTRASRPLNPHQHLRILYVDSHIVAIDKPSGVLSVPGPRRNPSAASLVNEYFGNEEDDVDKMIVHRLDMDTSGVLVFARDESVLRILHDAFRSKSLSGSDRNGHVKGATEGNDKVDVSKKYEALVCGHVSMAEGEIDLPLVRDRDNPPFMKVYAGDDMTFPPLQDLPMGGQSRAMKEGDLHKLKSYIKMISKAPKESLTQFHVLAWEFLDGDEAYPVTRMELVPITGRTHQLRVHCAAIGHPIVGDNIYGVNGAGTSYGGFSDEVMQNQFSHMGKVHTALQHTLHNFVQGRRNISKEHGDDPDYGMLCLHAKQLNILHPITAAPITFEADAPF